MTSNGYSSRYNEKYLYQMVHGNQRFSDQNQQGTDWGQTGHTDHPNFTHGWTETGSVAQHPSRGRGIHPTLWEYVTKKHPPYLDYQKMTERKIPIAVFVPMG
jgi:hypothetical protein